MPSPTGYPFRQALYWFLNTQITTNGLPAINAKFAANDLTKTWGSPYALAATDVIIGDLYSIGSNGITISCRQARIVPMSLRGYMGEFYTELGIKCVSIGGNSPQEFELFGTIIIDTLTDLFTSLTNYEVEDGSGLLPSGAFFTQMSIREVMKSPAPMKSAEGIVRVPAWTMTHYALMTYYLDRNDPLPVGG